MSDKHTPTDLHHVVLLGDHQTTDHVEMLEGVAAQHGTAISVVFSFEPGEAAGCQELADVGGLVAALSHAIATKLPIWVPYPREDLGREQHFRRIGLVLQRHGLNLFTGPHLIPCPTTGGSSEIDFALRTEVQAVDNLDQAALANGGVETLGRQIEEAMVESAKASRGKPSQFPEPADHDVLSAMSSNVGSDIMVSLPAGLPSPNAPWAQREPALRRHAVWLTRCCGCTQIAAAQCLNAIGQRTPQGCPGSSRPCPR